MIYEAKSTIYISLFGFAALSLQKKWGKKYESGEN